MTARLEGVVLPGPELEPKPIADRKLPIILRVVRVSPHGTAFRYDLEYYGLDPGTYDLRDYLRRKDGSPAGELPSLPVKIVPIRPPGQVQPNPLVIEKGPRVGGYWLAVIGLGTLWVLGFLAIVAWIAAPLFRNRRGNGTASRPLSLADRLRPLVQGAIAGQLAPPELAALERGLLAFWRKRLGLERQDPAEAMVTLRKHPEAGPLLAQLEAWLHRPGPPQAVDVGQLLAPYRDLPPDAADLSDAEPRPEGTR